MTAPDNGKPRTVSLAPNWRTAALIYIAALENGTAAGKQAAREGIAEMAEKFDRLIARVQEGDDAAKSERRATATKIQIEEGKEPGA